MAVNTSIFNDQRTYGNGLITIQGAFTDSGSAVVVTHGKGFTITRDAANKVYKVVLTAGFKGLHSAQATINAPASTGAGAFSHPGFALCGDLQSDFVTFFIYPYNFAGTQGLMGATNTPLEFALVLSISSLNP
jgi:hypothetical protein